MMMFTGMFPDLIVIIQSILVIMEEMSGRRSQGFSFFPYCSNRKFTVQSLMRVNRYEGSISIAVSSISVSDRCIVHSAFIFMHSCRRNKKCTIY